MAEVEHPWAGRRAALRGHIARARSFRHDIDRYVVKNAAEIAGREGLTRARVSQLFRLLKLALEVLADLEDEDGVGPVPREVELRKLAGVKSPELQLAQYQRLCGAEAAGRAPRRGATRGRPPQRGLQHLFERARRYHAALEAGTFESLEELGRSEGVTGRRIAHLLQLLQLDLEIIEVVDVPADQLRCGRWNCWPGLRPSSRSEVGTSFTTTACSRQRPGCAERSCHRLPWWSGTRCCPRRPRAGLGSRGGCPGLTSSRGCSPSMASRVASADGRCVCTRWCRGCGRSGTCWRA